jgi:TorA maturation chaperone TorD
MAAVAVAHPLASEDRDRAEFYALLARLYAEAPDAQLLRSIAGARAMDGDEALPTAWNRLIAASGVMESEAAAQEYTDLFVGVGACEVNLHASHWIAGAMLDRPLADLRGELASMGLSRRSNVVMLEDHLSALFETMRLLVAGHGDRTPARIGTQRAFFERHIDPWAFLCCSAIRASSIANYYGCVAELTEAFMALDRDALAMD